MEKIFLLKFKTLVIEGNAIKRKQLMSGTGSLHYTN